MLKHPLKLNSMKSVDAETSTQTEQYEVLTLKHPLTLNNMKSVNAETSTQTEQYEVC